MARSVISKCAFLCSHSAVHTIHLLPIFYLQFVFHHLSRPIHLLSSNRMDWLWWRTGSILRISGTLFKEVEMIRYIQRAITAATGAKMRKLQGRVSELKVCIYFGPTPLSSLFTSSSCFFLSVRYNGLFRPISTLRSLISIYAQLGLNEVEDGSQLGGYSVLE